MSLFPLFSDRPKTPEQRAAESRRALEAERERSVGSFLRAASGVEEGWPKAFEEGLCRGFAREALADAKGRPRSALARAARALQPENVRRLLAHGADVDGRDFDGMTPILAACDMSALHLRSLRLLPASDYELRDSDLWPRRRACLSLLIGVGADLSAKCAAGNNALALLASSRLLSQDSNRGWERECALALAAAGCPLDEPDRDGARPIHKAAVAAISGKPEVFRALLEAGADLEAKDGKGRALDGYLRGDLLLELGAERARREALAIDAGAGAGVQAPRRRLAL